jgi:hypothetical protein
MSARSSRGRRASARFAALLLLVLAARSTRASAQAVDSVQTTTPAETAVAAVAPLAPKPQSPDTGRFMTASAGLRNELFSSSTPFRVALGAIADQARWQPMAWGGMTSDFGARAGVRLAEVGAQLTVMYGVAALLNQDASYRPLREGSFVARAGHALLGSVTAYNRSGDRVFAPGPLVGALAAGVTARGLLPGDTPRSEITSRAASALTSRLIRTLWMEFLTRPGR